jgi:hypothetical protein
MIKVLQIKTISSLSKNAIFTKKITKFYKNLAKIFLKS